MKQKYLLAMLLVVMAAPLHAQQPKRVTPPVLRNRTEILAERARIAQRVLKQGDSLYIRVYARIDENGTVRWPEIKSPSRNAKADSAAIALVRKMVFAPARNAPRGVLMTIPVVLVRR